MKEYEDIHDSIYRLYEDTAHTLMRNAGVDATHFFEKGRVQETQFMVDIIPFVYKLFSEKICRLTALDVGSRSGAGADLLRFLHEPNSHAKVKLDVTALDIEPTFLNYAKFRYPRLKYRVDDIFNIEEEKWDLITCSHTIEHIPKYLEFIHRLQYLAKKYVIIACPYEEPEDNLIPEHCNSITGDFIQSLDPVFVHVYDSITWYQSRCVIFGLHGSGGS